MRRLLTILLVLFLSLAPATALREDFIISSETSTINVCACSYAKVPLRLANTGEVDSVYQVSQSGDAAPWAVLTTQRMTLEPGDATEATMFVRVPCDVQGSFDLRTTVKTLFDKEATLVQQVEVNSCSNLHIVPKTPTSQKACPCTPVKYLFMLENGGDHAEVYTVSVEPADYVSIGSPRLTLAAGQEAPIVVFINKPCSISGEFEHTLRVVSERAGWESTIPLLLTVDACYDYNVLVAPGISMCKAPGKTIHIPLTIQNTAPVRNSYDIKTRIRGTTTTYDPVTLRGGEQQVITLGVDLDAMPAGENDLRILTTPRRGESSLEKIVSFSALACDAGAGDGGSGAPKLWIIVLLISILFAVLIGILIRLRRPKREEEGMDSYYASSTRVTRKTKEDLAKSTGTRPVDLPGWFTPLLIIFIALGVLALLIGALFIADRGVAGEGGTTYVDSLDDLAVEPQTTMPSRAADPASALDSLISSDADIPLVERGWFVTGLMVIVFLVIVLLVLAIMLKTRAGSDNRSEVSTSSADEPVSVVFDDEKRDEVKAKRLDVARKAKTAKAAAGPASGGSPSAYFIALLALLLLAGAAFALYYAPAFFGGADGSRLRIDAGDLPTHRGAFITRIGETAAIPLTFQNPGGSDAHVDLEVPVDWIAFTQPALDIRASDEATVTMTVSPDESVDPGRYRMEFTIKTPDAVSQEDVVLLVLGYGENPRDAWSLAALITLGAILVFALLAYRKGRRGEQAQDATGHDAKVAKTKDTGASFTKTKRLKRKKVTLLALGFLLVLLVCTGIFGVLWRYTTIFGNHRPAPSEDGRTLGEMLLYTTPGIHESHVIVGDDRTIIPMRITNIHDDHDYKISVYEDIPWLSVDSDRQWIPPGESVVIPLVIDAHRGVDNGAYRISVDIRTGDDLDSIFTNDIVIVVHHSRRLYLAVLYIPYIILGSLLVIYLFLTKRRLKRWRQSRSGDDAVSAARKNGRTNIRLK